MQAAHSLICFQGSFLPPQQTGLSAVQHSPACWSAGKTGKSALFLSATDLPSLWELVSASDSCTVILDPLRSSVPGIPWNQATLDAVGSRLSNTDTSFLVFDSSATSLGRCGSLFPHDLFARGAAGAFAGLEVAPATGSENDDPLLSTSLRRHQATGLLESVPSVQADAHCRPDALILSRGLTAGQSCAAALLLSPALTEATSATGNALFHPRTERLRRLSVESLCADSAALVHGCAAAQPGAVRYSPQHARHDEGTKLAELQEAVRMDLKNVELADSVWAVHDAVKASVPVARLLLSYLDRLPVAHRDQVQDVFGPPPHPCSTGSDHCALDATLALKGAAQRLRQQACRAGLLLQSADGFVGLEDSATWNASTWGSTRPWHADRCVRITPPMTLSEDDARAGIAILDASFGSPTDLE